MRGCPHKGDGEADHEKTVCARKTAHLLQFLVPEPRRPIRQEPKQGAFASTRVPHESHSETNLTKVQSRWGWEALEPVCLEKRSQMAQAKPGRMIIIQPYNSAECIKKRKTAISRPKAVVITKLQNGFVQTSIVSWS